MASDGKGGKGRGSFVENVERRKWDLADFERLREEREDRELRDRVTNKSVVRAPLQRRTSDLALTRALGKYQGAVRLQCGCSAVAVRCGAVRLQCVAVRHGAARRHASVCACVRVSV